MQKTLNTYIDHTLLRPDATSEEIKTLCAEAIKYQFASVCVLPFWVKFVRRTLVNTPVKVCSVVGFPLGANTIEIKALEAHQLEHAGADELDMVLNISALKSKDEAYIQQEIEAVVKAAPSTIIKVIIEACLLSDEEKIFASRLCVNARAHFVKTSTGFSKSGATLHDVALLREVVGPKFGVKASGGIRNREQALAMIAAGATRLGTSSGVAIVHEVKL